MRKKAGCESLCQALFFWYTTECNAINAFDERLSERLHSYPHLSIHCVMKLHTEDKESVGCSQEEAMAADFPSLRV